MGKDAKARYFKEMRRKIRYDVPLDFLMQFDDIEKIKLLNSLIRNQRGATVLAGSPEYMVYLAKFYYCERFERIYRDWLDSEENRHLKPSLDHITPKALGGECHAKNLQAMTVLQNRAKCDMTPEEWEEVIENPELYFF